MRSLIASLLLFAVPALGQSFDVMLYRDAPNPDGAPTNWIAKIQAPLATNRPAPWIRITALQLATHQSNALPAFNAWVASRESAETTVKSSRAKLIIDTIADIDLALANWDTLTNAQQKAVLRRVVVIIRAMLKEELK